jgi:hypothetical protein
MTTLASVQRYFVRLRGIFDDTLYLADGRPRAIFAVQTGDPLLLDDDGLEAFTVRLESFVHSFLRRFLQAQATRHGAAQLVSTSRLGDPTRELALEHAQTLRSQLERGHEDLFHVGYSDNIAERLAVHLDIHRCHGALLQQVVVRTLDQRLWRVEALIRRAAVDAAQAKKLAYAAFTQASGVDLELARTVRDRARRDAWSDLHAALPEEFPMDEPAAGGA